MGTASAALEHALAAFDRHLPRAQAAHHRLADWLDVSRDVREALDAAVPRVRDGDGTTGAADGEGAPDVAQVHREGVRGLHEAAIAVKARLLVHERAERELGAAA